MKKYVTINHHEADNLSTTAALLIFAKIQLVGWGEKNQQPHTKGLVNLQKNNGIAWDL